MRFWRRTASLTAACTIGGALAAAPARAQVWDGAGVAGGDVNWTTAANWDTNVAPLNNGTALVTMAGTIDTSNTVNVGYDINSLTFSNTAGAFVIGNAGGATLTVRGGGITNNDAQTQTLNLPLVVQTSQTWAAAAGPITVAGSVSLGTHQLTFNAVTGSSALNGNFTGSGNLVKNGAGTLTLAGTNAFNTVNLNAGTLIPDTDTAFGAGTFVVNGGTLNSGSSALATRTLANAVTLNADFLTTGNAALVMSGAMTLTGNRVISAGNTSNVTTISGAIGQDVAGRQLFKTGAGQLWLTGSAPNTYTGDTVVAGSSLILNKTAGVNAVGGNVVVGDGSGTDVLQFLASNQIPDTATMTVTSSGQVDLNAFDETLATLNVAGGTITGIGTLTVTSQLVHDAAPNLPSTVSPAINLNAGTVAVTVGDGTASADLELAGAVSNGGITKGGAGALRFLGTTANTYTGTTTVNAGTLVLMKDPGVTAIAGGLAIGDGTGSDVVTLGAGGQIADSTVVAINSSGTLDLAGFVDTIGGLSMTGGTVTGTISFLGIGGTVFGNASTNTATVGGGSIGFGGATRIFSIADGAAAVDMDVTAVVNSGGISKTGAGTLRLGGTGANLMSTQSFVSQGTLLLGKPAGVNAINQTLNIGDAVGGADADVVRLQASEQIATGVSVIIARSGLLDLGDQDETISTLDLTAGHVVGGGLDGTLILGGTLSTVADTSSSLVEAEVSLGGGGRVINVANGTVADDLVVNGSIINGSLSKQGTGTLRLTGTTDNDNTVALGQLAAGTIVMDKPVFIDAFNGATAVVGDGGGGSQADVLRHGASDHQLPDSIEVLVNSSGLFDLNGRNETIGTLRMNSAGFVNTGGGTLTVSNSVVSDAVATGFGTINGNLNLAGGLRPFNVADSTPVVDLTVNAAMSNGTLQKQGPGRLQLSSSALTSPISHQLDAGTLAATGLVVGPTRTFTQNGGTFNGTLTNQGTFTYNGGLFTGSLVNDATAAFNANFTASSGISNTGTFAISAGTTVAADGSGLSNEGTVSLAGGTLTASGPIINQALITGRGTIGGSAGFTNNGLVSVSGGNLTLSNFASNTNSGNFDLAPGLQLRLQGAQLLNAGTLNLNAGTVNGFAALFNDVGGTVAGRGNITTAFTNNGTLMPDGGTLAVNIAFTNGGTILLGGAPASLAASTVTNNGIIRGDGTANATVNNNAAGEIRAEGGKSLLFTGATGANNGKVNLLGGTVQFDNALNNGATGLITGRGTLVAAGGLTNNGQVQLSAGFSDVFGTVAGNSGSKVIVSGGGTATFYDDVTSANGSEFRVSTGATAVFFGDVTGTNNFTGSGTKIFEAGSSSLLVLGSVVGDTVVEGGATLTAGRIDEDALTVNGLVTVSSGSTPASNVRTLAVASSGRLDLNDGALVLRNGGSGATGQTATQQATAALKTGLENGGNFDWLGPGISSTEAFNDNVAAGSVLYGLGVLQNNLAAAGSGDGTTTDATAGNEIYTTFRGSAVGLNDTLIRYTYMGDADLSGVVDSTDYSLIDSGFALGLAGWLNGDFDYSGSIDATDYALIDNAFAFQTGPLSAELLQARLETFGDGYLVAMEAVQRSTLVPEPAGVLVPITLCALARRGRRRAAP